MIVSFALINNRNGKSEMAHTLMDEVVVSYPKRVDVWIQYVDMLVKSKLIDSARYNDYLNFIQKIVVLYQFFFRFIEMCWREL